MAEERTAPVDRRGQADGGEGGVVVGVFAVFVMFGGEIEVVTFYLEGGSEAGDLFLRHALAVGWVFCIVVVLVGLCPAFLYCLRAVKVD